MKRGFLHYLNRNYYIQSHLVERLDELKGSDTFSRLFKVITSTVVLLEIQLTGLDKLFGALESTASVADSEAIIALLENVFNTVQHKGNAAPYLALLDYVSIADSLMAESAKMAELALVQAGELRLPHYDLYDAATLQQLISLLEDTITVS